MKVSYNWLKEYVDIPWEAKELANRLEMTGTAVESVNEVKAGFAGVVTGVILNIERHPQADKLSITKVDAGTGEELVIVCGASNIEVGQKVPVAVVGAVLPDDFKIGRASLRGVESNGMLCSETELKLGEDARGIMILDSETPIGRPLEEVLGIEDSVIEFEITPNRPDCMSMIGIAREVAALTGEPVKAPEITLAEKGEKAGVTVKIQDPDLCPRYTARVISGVAIGPSPYWLRARLIKAGIRPINNLVDITNYVLLETGQPLHAFDKSKVAQDTIIVRRAEDGEKMMTLDGVERILSPDMLVIGDAEGPAALAGIMGGGESEIDEGTTDCLLESAFFEPAGIFRTSSALDLRSEASARFERGTDPNGTMYAADRAAELMCSLAGGSVAGPAVDVYPSPIKPVEIPFETGKTRDLLGADIDDEQMISILSSLDICVENVKPGYFEAIAPTFRPDLRRSIDLTEEVARVFGFANVPSTIPDSKASATPLSPIQQTARDTRNILVAAGLMECVSYAFIDSADVASLMLPETDERKKLVKIKNPLSENQSVMRPSLLPGLFRAIRFNAGYGQSNGALFELGRVFAPRGTDKPAELTMAACALSGARNGDEWYDKENPYDFYDIKGIVETLIDRLRLGQASIEPSDDPLYHPGQRACLLIKGKPAGMFGMLHPYAADAFELTGSVFAGEFDTGILAESRMGLSKITPPSRYPAVIRDIAVLVDTGINASDIEKIILGAAGDLLNHVRPFDLYQGEKIKDGKKSLAYRLEYRSDERTLTVEEVDAAHAKIFEALRAALKAEIR